MTKEILVVLMLFLVSNFFEITKKTYTVKLDNTAQTNFVLTRTPTSYKLLINGTTVSLINLPDVRQAEDYTCGPSSLQTVLMYYGIEKM